MQRIEYRSTREWRASIDADGKACTYLETKSPFRLGHLMDRDEMVHAVNTVPRGRTLTNLTISFSREGRGTFYNGPGGNSLNLRFGEIILK